MIVADIFVLDTSALITFLQNEDGADRIDQILHAARLNKCTIVISFISLTELYYILWQEQNESAAKETVALVKALPLAVVHSDERLALMAGRIKATFRLSLADALIASTAILVKGILIHKDPEFIPLEKILNALVLPFKKSDPKRSAVRKSH